MGGRLQNCAAALAGGLGLLAAGCQTADPRLATPALAAGRRIYNTQCISCHSPEPVSKYTLPEWDEILAEMTKKAKLDSTQKAELRAYIVAAHGGGG